MMDINWIRDWAEENKYQVVPKGENPQIAIVGESHGNGAFIKQQERLVDKLKPEYLLHECIGINTYDPSTHQQRLLEGRRVDEFDVGNEIPDYMIQWSEKDGLFLVGCDLSMREVEDCGKILAQRHPERYKWDPEFQMTEVLDNDFPYFTNQDDGVVPFRDTKIGGMMVEYAGKTSKPLITIMGAHHMRPESPIHQILGNSNIGYICIDQTFGREKKKGLDAVADMDIII
jgi:hypothetical protein